MGMVGKFSKYKKLLVTPSESYYLTFECSFAPKVIIISCASDSEAQTSNNRLRDGIFDFEKCGCMTYLTSNAAKRCGSYLRDDNSITTSAFFGLVDSTTYRINRFDSTNIWSVNTAYTVEIYA